MCGSAPSLMPVLTVCDGWPPPNHCRSTADPSEGCIGPLVLPKLLLKPICVGNDFCMENPTMGVAPNRSLVRFVMGGKPNAAAKP